MAQFTFYASETDRIQILNAILIQRNYTFIGNRCYQEPKPCLFDKMCQALLDNISVNKLLFIKGPFSKLRIQMDQLKGGEYAGSYVVQQNMGGPLLEMSLPGSRREGELVNLTPGDLFYALYYWGLDGEKTFRPTEELKLHYQLLIKTIKKHLIRYDVGHRIWIGNDACHLLEQGAAKILSRGKWLTISDIRRK